MLEGFAEGRMWKRLDKRSGESFARDQQARMCTVTRPGTYRHCLLVPDGAAPLAEVELLS
ncbi:hypothetical protein GKQ77_15490 [Streptomyces sp. BG9H]|uniref:Uncharacterized protein n=1 Tax=Streptomyces anatolicus TaxID=2675858 RepID=A0ABS6YNH5_9ACTN|nr:hypothetical protein [Streptomyces anatolicus]MBW5422953.1 hypothetical protein [Streptomyces anatolicus]